MPSTINLQNVQIKNGNTWYTMCPFPVGFIYLSQKSTSPATTFGGTWAALNEDRFLRPSNAWTTGGSKKISIQQMPSHDHALSTNNAHAGWTGTSPGRFLVWSEQSLFDGWGGKYENFYKTPDGLDLMSNTGGGQITGPNIAIATVGIGLHSLYLLDGGER